MDKVIEKLLDFIGKSGEKIMVPDLKSGNIFVIMRLQEYEKLEKGQAIAQKKAALIDEKAVQEGEIGNQLSEEEKGDQYFFEPRE